VRYLGGTFITLALSAGEGPGWEARVCGTSERMIFDHYSRWMPGAMNEDRSATLAPAPVLGPSSPAEGILVAGRAAVALHADG